MAGVWVRYPDWEKQMVRVELVHEGTEQITLAEKVHSKKTEWHYRGTGIGKSVICFMIHI